MQPQPQPEPSQHQHQPLQTQSLQSFQQPPPQALQPQSHQPAVHHDMDDSTEWLPPPRRIQKSVAKLKNTRCTVRPERQALRKDGQTRGRTDKARLGEVYAQIYDRLAATDPTEDSLSHLFSDKELRIVMGKPQSPRTRRQGAERRARSRAAPACSPLSQAACDWHGC